MRTPPESTQSPGSVAESGPAPPPINTSDTVSTVFMPPSPAEPAGQLSAMPSPQLLPVMNRLVPAGIVVLPRPQKSRAASACSDPLAGAGLPRVCSPGGVATGQGTMPAARGAAVDVAAAVGALVGAGLGVRVGVGLGCAAVGMLLPVLLLWKRK